MTSPVELGLIEGFYGPPWSAEGRRQAVRTLAPAGYGFYLYAPKADDRLRRRWREPHPEVEAAELAAFAADCRAAGVRFGVGLSPFELWLAFDEDAKRALADKLRQLDEMDVEDLAVLFDDMRGDLPDLAERQAEIVDFIAGRTRADRLIVCPSYYSDDPVLDRVFGARSPGYLETLGRRLDPAVQVFWTGDEVCARSITPGSLERVTEQLRRPPMLWDNYPVNDGPRMSKHLHLRAFTGRPASLPGAVSAHGINVALQPTLSLIPALTLAESYRLGDRYAYGPAFLEAATRVLGEDLAGRLQADLLSLDDAGLDRLDEGRRSRLRARYAAFDHPGAAEIVGWLDGAYAITPEEMATS